jgi:hypothetical protein
MFTRRRRGILFSIGIDGTTVFTVVNHERRTRFTTISELKRKSARKGKYEDERGSKQIHALANLLPRAICICLDPARVNVYPFASVRSEVKSDHPAAADGAVENESRTLRLPAALVCCSRTLVIFIPSKGDI